MDFITLLDGIVITIVLLSALLAMFRGFIREVLSIAAWVAAAAAAYLFHKPLLPYAAIGNNDKPLNALRLLGFPKMKETQHG